MSAPTLRALCPICHTSNRADARFCQKCGNNIWLNDRYRIVRAIKEGGMGAVYEAADDGGRRYALKALIDRFTDPKERDEAVARFKEEAAILRELNHPQIPRVYNDFLHGGRYYLAMDFVEGEDLEDIQRRQPNERFDEATVLRWADQIANVLDYLHERRLIYRDMKPSNIMVEKAGGNLKVVDFGIAKLFQPNERGTLIGTPGYSPPEQYQGQATPQSDIYALGATLHHLLTGRDPRDEAPFSFPPVRQLAPEVSAQTERAISRALEMELDKRWPSAAAFRAALPTEIGSRGRKAPQPTVALDPAVAAASLGSVPQAQKAVQPAPPAKPAPKNKPKPQPAPAAKPQKPFRWWIPLLVVLVVGALIALGQPGVSDRLSAMFGGSSATSVPATPSSGPLVRQTYNAELTVSVPAGSTADQIYDAFILAFKDKVVAEFGAQAQINMNAPPTYQGGAPVQVGEENGNVTYRATLNGRISAPQQ
ncbi:MAG TPA: serine/threonine-protein kinase [Herpetosiphonaceae bacterium]|nr:serine/threonine-protein kinase [Herpetosiphonaceae bacterium]